MSTRLFAILFVTLFLTGIFPVLFVQNLGSASAGITAGFLLPAQDVYHVGGILAIGLVSAWAGGEAILIFPLCALLMLAAGSFTEIDDHAYPAVHIFLAGAIILFALCVSILRRKKLLLAIPPIAAFAYFSGSGFMQTIPTMTTPLFFLMGTTISCCMMLAIGIAFGITFTDKMREVTGRYKNAGAFASFLSLF